MFLRAVALLKPPARPTTSAEVGSAPEWLGVCEYPGQTPVQMAIDAGRAALKSSNAPPSDVRWVVHSGSGAQGALGWPMHHSVQQGIVGNHGNALELKQYCSGGLTSWLVASGMLSDNAGTVLCTGADNWSFGDRFATSRVDGGEPFSDVAHAAVLSTEQGFASILSTSTASCPSQADLWQTRDEFWQHPTLDDYRDAFVRAAATRTAETDRDTLHMVVNAISGALDRARLSPQYVTHFVPHTLGSGGLYRNVAGITGLPWSQRLYEFYLGQGYLGVSTAVAGLVYTADETGLAADSIVLLLAVEYLLSATAVVLRITRPPAVTADGLVRVAA